MITATKTTKTAKTVYFSVCACFALSFLYPLSSEATIVTVWRIGAILCQPKIDAGEPDVLSGLGYANVWPNYGSPGDSYYDTYCRVDPDVDYPVNRMDIMADLGDTNNDIHVYLFQCSYENEFCTALESYWIYADYGGRHQYSIDFDTCYLVHDDPSSYYDYYYMVEIRLEDGDTGDSDIPRAYWVGLYYDTTGATCGESADGVSSEHDPFPECAGGCSGDCSFLSHPDDEFWYTVDWELDWRDYCRDPAL